MKMYFWTFNGCDEVWRNGADSVEECLENARAASAELSNQRIVYIGVISVFAPHVDAGEVIDRLIDQAYDECGEVSEGWLEDVKDDHENELEDALNKVFGEWIGKYGYEPSFGLFDETWCYNLTTGTIIDKKLIPYYLNQSDADGR